MRSLLVPIVAASLLVGCAAARVRKEAAITLDCGSVRVTENRENACWVADGCGRRAYCVLPDVEHAEVSCVGGAPVVASSP